MIYPVIPDNEKERLQDLESYSLLDTLPESDIDNLSAIAAEICDTPIALVVLVDEDRQWFKSRYGLEAPETPREHSFCGHAINDPLEVFIVQDATTDERFSDNPLVTGDPHIAFYAGVPLLSEAGFSLGTLCVIDREPRVLSDGQINSLKALSHQVMQNFELRKKKYLLQQSMTELKERNLALERFASIAAHDIKSPLNCIIGFSNLLQERYNAQFDEDGKMMLDSIDQSSQKLKELVDCLLDYSRNEAIIKENKSTFPLPHFIEGIRGLFSFDENFEINFESELTEIATNKTALEQILINLVSNGLKYCDKDEIRIDIAVTANEDSYHFVISDNGPGIPKKYQDKIFNIFEVAAVKDRYGNRGNGIGLATVKKLVEALDGSIELVSNPNKGAEFRFQIGR